MDFNNKVMETLTAITENNEEDKQDLANLKQSLIDGTFNVKYLTWAIMATNDENGNRIIDTYATIERLTQVLEALTQEISDRKAADDLEKKERKEETSAIINSVNQEISDRTNAVSVLNNLITAETENRASEDEKVLQYAQSVNEALGNAKTDLQGKIDSEAQTRLTSDNEIKASITSKEDSLKALINSVKNELNGYITTLNNRVNNLPTNYVFDTYESMTNDLLNASNAKYKVGDTLFIKEVNKPDYWVSAILSTKGTYGYYELSEQESKVDLSNYVKISELSREAIEEKFLETVDNGTKSFAARSFAATSRNSGIDVNNYAEYGYDGVSFHKNGMEYPLGFPEKDGVFALTSDIPQALKNPFTLTINGKVYDGSSAVSITTETITEHDFVRFWHAGIEIQNDGSEHVLRLSDFDTELEEFSPHISCQYDGPQYYWIWKFPQISGTFAMESQIPTKLSQLTNDGNYQTNTSDLKDNTTTFTTASTRSNVASGEKLSVSLGKIAKYFNDLKAIAFSGDKRDIDLGNVDNTSDKDKPVSTATQQALNNKANASDVYSKTETDGLLNNKANTNDVYSKTKTDELLNNKANKSDVYTKSETDGLLNNKANSSDVDAGLNKSLYNLGAYDTISGNVITRQTGYVDLGSLSWTYNTNYHYFESEAINGIAIPSDDNTLADIFSSNYTAIDRNHIDTPNNKIAVSTLGRISVYTDGQSTNLPKGLAQYKLATPYTEEIIEGQPLITLDSQGSQWLRDEWEKGLNLWSFKGTQTKTASGNTITLNDSIVTISGTNTGEGVYFGPFAFSEPIKANKTYTISIPNQYGISIAFYDVNGNEITHTDYVSSFTFTPNVDMSQFTIWITGNGYAWGTTTIQLMLNEGNHPYPYQAYNGEIVHDKDIANLDKQEYNLGYYDTMVENADGTYTITRQTGYLVLDGVENKFSEKSSSTHNGLYYNHNDYVKSNALKPSNTEIVGDIICNLFETKNNNDLFNYNEYGVGIYTDGSICVGLTTAITTIDEANAYLMQNPISIQYKLATSTTEKVEKNHYATYNKKFILEHNKSEAERSANLFNPNNVEYGSINEDGTNLGNGTARARSFYIPVSPNTYYSISSNNSELLVYELYQYDSNKSHIAPYTGISNYTFTFLTRNNTYYIRILFRNTTNTDFNLDILSRVMLNEGSVALPYQPYEGKVVHEKELQSITPGIFSLVGNNVDTLTISKNETYFITSVAVNPIYVEGNSGISFIGSSLVSTVGMLSGEPKICLNGSAYTLDNNSVTLKTSGLMKVYKVNY